MAIPNPVKKYSVEEYFDIFSEPDDIISFPIINFSMKVKDIYD